MIIYSKCCSNTLAVLSQHFKGHLNIWIAIHNIYTFKPDRLSMKVLDNIGSDIAQWMNMIFCHCHTPYVVFQT